MALIDQWLEEAEAAEVDAVQTIREKVWQFFREHIAGKLIYKILRIVTKIEVIFTEIFGPEPQ